ncbi:hypothetical protein PtA15_7A497 [Puccinia triticina]|uniref:Uncharacterized protein n=1 Tax=Puccinia triticina TaxID=208348 RepID=A0ABY7CNF7_9BASI|nr:uncharacterized protein PtA15_7A497 [Puccinia triticina]WAQ86768.1 hypothetical protein PtA15_7A497 [Puccinia triticina]
MEWPRLCPTINRAAATRGEEDFLLVEEGDEVVTLAADKLPAVERPNASDASELASIIAIPSFTTEQVTAIVTSTDSPAVVTVDVEAERAHIWKKIQESHEAGDYILSI